MLLINVHSQHPKKPSSVPPPDCIYPLQETYWDVQAKLLTEKLDGMDKETIREAVSHLKYEDEAYHERMIARLIHEYDDYSSSCEVDGVDSTDSDEFKTLLTESDLGICLVDMEIWIKSLQQGKIQSKILQL